jgi:hypothetical protein
MCISRDPADAANLVHDIGGDKRAFEIAMQQLSPALAGENPFSRTRALSFSLEIGLADAPVGLICPNCAEAVSSARPLPTAQQPRTVLPTRIVFARKLA